MLTNEYVDLLAHVIPNEAEAKAFSTYEAENKPLGVLSPTDQFMLQVGANGCFQQAKLQRVESILKLHAPDIFLATHLAQPYTPNSISG